MGLVQVAHPCLERQRTAGFCIFSATIPAVADFETGFRGKEIVSIPDSGSLDWPRRV